MRAPPEAPGNGKQQAERAKACGLGKVSGARARGVSTHTPASKTTNKQPILSPVYDTSATNVLVIARTQQQSLIGLPATKLGLRVSDADATTETQTGLFLAVLATLEEGIPIHQVFQLIALLIFNVPGAVLKRLAYQFNCHGPIHMVLRSRCSGV